MSRYRDPLILDQRSRQRDSHGPHTPWAQNAFTASAAELRGWYPSAGIWAKGIAVSESAIG
jgi:hypothetical protein